MGSVISGMVLIACIICFVIFCFKGYSPFIVALAAVLFLGLVSQTGVLNALFTVFPSSIGASFTDTFLMFASSSVFGLIFSETKFAVTMGKFFSGRVKKPLIPFIVMAFAALVNLVGLPKSDFIIASFAFPLLVAADLPLYLGLVAGISMGTVVAWGLPGLPGLPNILPAGIFGIESLYVAPLAGWCMTIGGLAAAIFYLYLLTRRAIAKGVGYVQNENAMFQVEAVDEMDKAPSKFLSVMPMLILLMLSYLFNLKLGLDAVPSVVVAQAIGTVFMLIVGHRYMDHKQKIADSIVEGIFRIAPVCLCIGAVTAFANVAADTSAYQDVMSGIFDLNIHPYLTVIIIVSVIAGITSDGIATLFILQSTDIAAKLLGTGADAGILCVLSRAACPGRQQ